MPFQPLIEELEYRDPAEALRAFAPGPGLVLLDSAMPHPTLGRWSWLASRPVRPLHQPKRRRILDGEPLDGHPIDALRRQLGALRRRLRRSARCPFAGGATGFFAYEAGRLFERLPAPKAERRSIPEIDLWFHDVGIAFDVVDRRAFLVSTGWPEERSAAPRAPRAASGPNGCADYLTAPPAAPPERADRHCRARRGGRT